jgi:hypothetical protein
MVRRIFLSTLALMLLSSASFVAPARGQVAIGVTVAFAPPDLPVYEQPLCPGVDYLWVPGYWAWDGDDYFWVPGTWVLAPQPGFFWTPGYWAWGGNGFFFTTGYWGPVVGFYGGINYGFGYFGHGYEGGRWEGEHFFYNRTVNNVNVTVIHNTYNTTIVNRTATRVSYNGGDGGINARATSEEEAAARGRHMGPVEAQTRHIQEARRNPELRVSQNRGLPPIAATAKPGELRGGQIVAAREAGAVHGTAHGNGNGSPASHPENRAEPNNGRPNPVIHAKDMPPGQRPAPPNTGDPKLDKRYQGEQQKMAEQQAKERGKLQQRQEKEDQRVAQQHADQARQQEMERKHQQETQKLTEKHNQERQHMQDRQQPKPQSRPAPSKPPEKPH